MTLSSTSARNLYISRWMTPARRYAARIDSNADPTYSIERLEQHVVQLAEVDALLAAHTGDDDVGGFARGCGGR